MNESECDCCYFFKVVSTYSSWFSGLLKRIILFSTISLKTEFQKIDFIIIRFLLSPLLYLSFSFFCRVWVGKNWKKKLQEKSRRDYFNSFLTILLILEVWKWEATFFQSRLYLLSCGPARRIVSYSTSGPKDKLDEFQRLKLDSIHLA